ncbi:hypothetical protein MK280_10840, partial [Myxococcota bacterium]|nr:hypothetical protein [Myxococcota bacterium]
MAETELRTDSLTHVGLSERTRHALAAAGIAKLERLEMMSDEQLLQVPGIGGRELREVHAALEEKSVVNSDSASTLERQEKPILLTDVNLSARPANALAKAGFRWVHEIENLPDGLLFQLPHLGRKSLNEIRRKIPLRLRPPVLEDAVSLPDVPDPLLEIPSPDPAAGADPQFLSLLDASLGSVLSDREAEIMRQRMSIPDGGRWKTLQGVGDQFSLSRERIRQLVKRSTMRLAESDDPHAAILRRYVERTLDELGEGDPAAGVARYADVALPNGPPGTVINFLSDLGAQFTGGRSIASDAAFLHARFRVEAIEAKRDAKRATRAEKILDRWVENAVWPARAATALESWVPQSPGRAPSQDEVRFEYDSTLLRRSVTCDSKLEQMFFDVLDRSGKVSWYVEQPFSVSYTDRSGRNRNYWPDALARLVDNRWLLVEVKPLISFISVDDHQKWSAAAERCRGRGVGFV